VFIYLLIDVLCLITKKDVVTCLSIDYTGSLIVSGSMDTTCMIWQVVHEYGLSVNLDPTPMHILYGHTDCVTSVDISNELDLVVSASLDGTVNMYTIRTGSFVKSLSFRNEKIAIFKNLSVKLSNERHVLVYTSGLPFENTTQLASEQTKV
jgi:WD40 repeat protein